jgi:hypothetical protein
MAYFRLCRHGAVGLCLLAVGLALALPARPQETATQDQPNSSPPATSQNATDSTKEAPPKPSDRILGIVPAFTITDLRNAPALTSKQKFGLFAKGTLDPFPFILYAAQAGISQARDTHHDYGQGAAGYSKRFAAALADGTSARLFGTYVFPSLLHQDPRYFRKNDGSGWSRARYSVSRAIITRSDSGKTQFNWSNVLGKFTAAGLSNLYYPNEDRGPGLTLSRVGISLAYQTMGNLAIEFWPEIRRKLPGGKQQAASDEPE